MGFWTFLSGAGGAALMGGAFALLQWWLNRRAKKQDTASAVSAGICAARGEELKEVKRLIDVLVEADRTILYDRIKHIGKSYIAREYITLEELEDLERMHQVYHDKDKLNGNGFLDELMKTVKSLPKRAA